MAVKIIQLAAGLHGVRQIAGARAEIELRKLGWIKPDRVYRDARYRPWTDAEYDDAMAMVSRGMSREAVAARLKRSEHAVNKVLGYSPTQRTGAAR